VTDKKIAVVIQLRGKRGIGEGKEDDRGKGERRLTSFLRGSVGGTFMPHITSML
jgi:hypothetical protein